MLLERATLSNVTRAMEEINAFQWEEDFKPLARKALRELLEKRLEEEMTEYLGLGRYAHAADRHDYRTAIMCVICSPRWET
jgi:transposase-like protein